LNLRELINRVRPDTAEPYYKLNREERHLGAILFHLLQHKPNCEWLLKSAGCNGQGWDIVEDHFGIYFEYSYPRDLWSSLNKCEKRDVNERKREIILEMLRICGATEGLLSHLKPINEQAFNQFFVGNNKKADGEDQTADLGRNLQSPANWRLARFDQSLKDAGFVDDADLIAVCKLKWSFRIKPDIVIQTDNNRALCVELKLESGEGSYPSDGAEKKLLEERFKKDYSSNFPVRQRRLQEFLMTKLLGIESRFLLVHKRNRRSKAVPEVPNGDSADSIEDLKITWAELVKSMDCSSLPKYMDFALKLASGMNVCPASVTTW